MLPQRSVDSRYLRSARAAHLARLVAAGAIVVVPAACGGSDDAEVFGASTASTSTSTTTATTTTAADVTTTVADGGDTSSTSPSSTSPAGTNASASAPTTTPTTASGDTTAPAASGAAFPAGGELVVDFTYAPDATGGRVRNPYVAVWVEDAAGNYVSTIAVWYEQSDKGTRWLSDLRAWMSASGGEVATTSTGATRSAGSYSVVWDGTDLDGNAVAQGDYVVLVEAAREHGPYEVTSAAITIGDAGTTVTLPDNGELSGLTATLAV